MFNFGYLVLEEFANKNGIENWRLIGIEKLITGALEQLN
jgi:hypothetical protein